MNQKQFWKGLTAATALAGAVAALIFSAQIVETNQAENYQVKQAAVSGDMSIIADPGLYMQNFGKITTYRISDDILINGLQVRFRDGSNAAIYGTVKYRLPVDHDDRMRLHREMQSYTNARNVLISSAIEGALIQTANLFGAEEVYSTRRSEFIQLFRDQLIEGIYKTTTSRQMNDVVYSAETGRPVIAKPSVLSQYGIEIVNVEVGDIDFDTTTDNLIQSRKEAEQQETLARAEAEKAKQEALTAEERGKADVARAKYEALVVKEKEVIEAEKKTAVERENTLQAVEYARQVEAKGKAEAVRQAALVEAGLSPKEQAEIEKETAIGVAEALAKIKLPSTMVFGGGEGSPTNPFDAIGIKFYQDLARDSSLQTNPNTATQQ